MELDINFREEIVEVENGVNFYATVKIPCTVTQEMLQDIDPENRLEDKITQFVNNKIRLQDIAEEKINKACRNIVISTEDLK